MQRCPMWLVVAVVASTAGFARAETRDAVAEEVTPLLGDARKGAAVFEAKGCKTCHAPPRQPPLEGPDLSKLRARDAGDLVAALFNHAPRMQERMLELGLKYPTFALGEMTDLFAYLYFLGAAEPAGDAGRGETTFRSLGCAACHPTDLDNQTPMGPALPYWSAHTTPIRFAHALWEHAGAMHEVMKKLRVRWPEFTDESMVDVAAYVSSVAKVAERRHFESGDPVAGRRVFQGKGCVRCHASGIGGAPDPSAFGRKARTLLGVAALMWNHYPKMRLPGAEGPTASISEQEFSDLAAYILSLRYFDRTGSAAEGRRIFAKRRCDGCHGEAAPESRSLADLRGQATPAAVAGALWNHGPRMLEAVRARGGTWPQLRGEEIPDLAAFLNAGK